MSADMVDALEAAEDEAAVLRSALREILNGADPQQFGHLATEPTCRPICNAEGAGRGACEDEDPECCGCPCHNDFLKAIAPFVEPYDRMADTGEIAVTYYDESWSLYYTGTDLVTAEPIEIWPLPPGDDSSRPLTANEQLVAGVLAKVFAFQPDNPALAAIVTALGDAEVLAPVPAKVRD